jgi:hypothetical protein
MNFRAKIQTKLQRGTSILNDVEVAFIVRATLEMLEDSPRYDPRLSAPRPLGQDAIDCVVVLGKADTASGVVNLRVRHVPPAQPKITLPADWMRVPVAQGPNNWVQVMRTADGRYIASVGKETFDVEIKLSLWDGSIVSAHMDNPVTVSERECTDEALTQCGKATNYQILRVVDIARAQ